MRQTLRSLLALARVRISNVTIYRLSFFTGFFVDATVFLTQLVFLRLVTANAVTEWSHELYSVFVGSFMTLDGVWMTTWFFGIVSLPDKIRSGELDLVLLKPVNPLLYLTFCNIDVGSLPVTLVGLIVTFASATRGGFVTLPNVLLWLCAMLLMYALSYAISLSLHVLAFWTKSTSMANTIENTTIEAAMRLPLPAIKGAYRIVLLGLLPYGLFGNLPAMAMAGQTTPIQWLYITALTAAFSALALLLWRAGLRRYESASS